jgi:predicted transglutaminase-like cysteine proteinase
VTIDVYEALERINFEVNNDIQYRTDIDLYGRGDFWAIVQGRGQGDCEDYALTKRARLTALGVPLELLRLALVFTETRQGRDRLAMKRRGEPGVMGDHAILVGRAPNGDWNLDNRFPLLTRLSETGYDLDRIQIAGTYRWEHGVLPGN